MLEMLKDEKSLDGYMIHRHPIQSFPETGAYINIDSDENIISFKLDTGEKVPNGCRIDTMVQAAAMIAQGHGYKRSAYHMMAALGHLSKIPPAQKP